MNVRTSSLTIGFLASVLILCGCGPEKPDWQLTSGNVTFDGQPVGQAEVVFYADTPPVSRICQTDDQGRFEFLTHIAKGLPVGEYEVVVRPVFIDPVLRGDFDPSAKMPPPMNRQDIPKMYRQRKTSTLKFVVAEGVNEMQIELKNH